MNFTLTINGETPAELLAALQQLNVPAALQPQSVPVAAPTKQQRPAPAKPEKPAQKPAAASAEKKPKPPREETPANPTAPAEPAGSSPAPTSAQPGTGGTKTAPSGTTATAPSSEPEKDPVTEGKIRSLIMALMKQGKRAECQKIITDTGAKGISSLPPESYTGVWKQLCALKDEVASNAAD